MRQTLSFFFENVLFSPHVFHRVDFDVIQFVFNFLLVYSPACLLHTTSQIKTVFVVILRNVSFLLIDFHDPNISRAKHKFIHLSFLNGELVQMYVPEKKQKNKKTKKQKLKSTKI